MNIYEKLLNLRDDALRMNIRKSGYNNHLNYSYYELSDIRPAANALEKKYKLLDRIYVSEGMAYLELINIENLEEKMLFSLPFGSSNLKNCHEIQNIGSSDTYVQRYLLRDCLGLVDGDALELTAGTVFDVHEAEKELRNASNLSELKTVWERIYRLANEQERNVLTIVKDEVKQILSQAEKE